MNDGSPCIVAGKTMIRYVGDDDNEFFARVRKNRTPLLVVDVLDWHGYGKALEIKEPETGEGWTLMDNEAEIID